MSGFDPKNPQSVHKTILPLFLISLQDTAERDGVDKVWWSERWKKQILGLVRNLVQSQLSTLLLQWNFVFWGGSSYFQIKYSVNMSGKVELLKTWERTTTLLMWLWPVWMISRWKLPSCSWMGRYSLIDYFTVIITSTSLLRSRQEAAAGRWWSSQPSHGSVMRRRRWEARVFIYLQEQELFRYIFRCFSLLQCP